MVQTPHSLKTLALVLGVAAMLSGCPAPARRPQPSPPPPNSPTPSAPTGSPSSISPAPGSPQPRPPRQNSLSPATRSLVTQSRSLLAHGDFNGASSTLDRALRIEPNNPLLWIELGRVRLVEGDARQAEGCGRKALALASGDHGAQQQSGRLLADALRAQQRNQEAREVESQPFMN
ncbi:MAG TPA: tetratricopeptide repeat protein [Steroidobacteraceae bacterium]|nr:tetratricopeptide repeat protein [Steroidobacteraceae bacterium]